MKCLTVPELMASRVTPPTTTANWSKNLHPPEPSTVGGMTQYR
jgi:hypothetical protein